MDVELTLSGERIGASALHQSLGELLDLLEGAAEVLHVEPQDWRIDGLRAASAHVSLAAPEGGPVARELVNGIEALRRAAAIPDGWSMTMVRRVYQLATRSGSGGTEAVSLSLPAAKSVISLDAIVATHAQDALGTEVVNVGSLRGRVDRWNEHSKRREIGLSRDEGGSLTVKYGRNLSDRIVSEALGQHVEIWGKVKRNLAGQVVGMSAEDFRVLAERHPVPIRSLRGIYGGTEGAASGAMEDWIRERHAE
jgi:hypothetical protein